MAKVKVTIGGLVVDIDATNSRTAAGALMQHLKPKPGTEGILQAELARAIAAALNKRTAFEQFGVGELLAGTLTDQNWVQLVKPEAGEIRTGGVGAGQRFIYVPGQPAPSSEAVAEALHQKKLSSEVAAENVWLKTTCSDYKITGVLGKKTGATGVLYSVSKDGNDFVFKTARATHAKDYADELAALRALPLCPPIIKLIPNCDALIILEKGLGDVESQGWTRDERTVNAAFRPLAQALAKMHEMGYWHDDLHEANLLLFDGDLLKLIDVGGKKGNPPQFAQNVREFIKILQGRIKGQQSVDLHNLATRVAAGNIVTMQGVLDSPIWV
jgi:hypothetical protein